MKNFFTLLILCVAFAIQAQPCEFIPVPPEAIDHGQGSCELDFILREPALSVPECACIPDPKAAPVELQKKFDLIFKFFSPTDEHLAETPIHFDNVPEAGCADVTITMNAIGDLSSRPFEDLVLVDENGRVICRVGGADCEMVQSVCTMRFCDFNSQISGGLRWRLLPNSLIASSSGYPHCAENWVDIKLSIPQSNIKTLTTEGKKEGDRIQLPNGKYIYTWTAFNKLTCEEMTVTQEYAVTDNIPPVFMPSCPTNTITLNAGPGECEVSWNAPVFM
ncbi:MAG TPA: hypothetical protein PK006_13205, partial [Saprospiraceae bacterium]|nr:hypothetical protein [Saprospiraceae bacterium]